MSDIFDVSLVYFADASNAVTTMRDYIAPTIRTLAALASIVCTFFIMNAGYLYMTSGGRPEQLEHAKHLLRNALLGIVIVLAATTLTAVLSNAYGQPAGGQVATLPNLEAIPPEDVGNGLVDVLIKAVTGFLNAIIQAVATPFLAALSYFTKATPLMADNASVFNLWLAIVGMTNVLFTLVLVLLGFHVMSAASFGFEEIEFKHLLPRVGLVFLLLNTSIFLIDGVIELSNVLIDAIGKVSGTSTPWESLTSVVNNSSGQGLAALLMMLAFLIFSVILLVYYVGRLVTLFIGAVLSPLIVLIWLIPGFRDFSETAMKTYITTIFILFIHVIILQLAASLFTGMTPVGANKPPDTLMAVVVGLATIVALLKTQSVSTQFSYVSMGSRNTRKLGGQFMNGVSYMTNKTGATKLAGAANRKVTSMRNTRAEQRINTQAATFRSKDRSPRPSSASKQPSVMHAKNPGNTVKMQGSSMNPQISSSRNNSKDEAR